ncbi:hypothetical protein, partial [Neobacillus vireti]|uniref:hypothetical protein n=1 Tax=Neobacillus vireti TaxID=220686 RepID=UPI002FFFE3CA
KAKKARWCPKTSKLWTRAIPIIETLSEQIPIFDQNKNFIKLESHGFPTAVWFFFVNSTSLLAISLYDIIPE